MVSEFFIRYIIIVYIYLDRLFPYKSMFDWFSYGHDPSNALQNKLIDPNDRDYFHRREWSFTIQDDIYIRYQCFRNLDEMREMIQKRQPHKIDIGAVFSKLPKDHNSVSAEEFYPKERELVFDIDMTDYDNIRTCCTGANICLRCWPYMTMALKVVNTILKEDFAFEHILWIYSGRRGIHCWVCDENARFLANEARSHIVTYMSINVDDGENSDTHSKSLKQPFHYMIQRAYSILEPMFEKYIASDNGQALLTKKDSYIKILNNLPNELIRRELYEMWEKQQVSSNDDIGIIRWKQIKVATMPDSTQSNNQQQQKKRKVDFKELELWRYQLVLRHCYPRLDANVSTSQNHLLKSPFCVHPKTGRVCVPIDPLKAEEFNPFDVPTVRILCKQVRLFIYDLA